MEKRVTIDIDETAQVSGVLHMPDTGPETSTTAVILAHGAGNDMNNPLLTAVCARLSKEGFPALRFNFPYKEAGRKVPDSHSRLVASWRSAGRYMRESSGLQVGRLVVGGKSMGGRIASQMVAEGLLPVDALVFLGYPLHPPGKKDRLRDAHLYTIHVPMLFVAGTRDKLCDPEKLNNVLAHLKVPWALEKIDGGDHSFKVPKTKGVSQEKIFETIAQKTAHWVAHLFQKE